MKHIYILLIIIYIFIVSGCSDTTGDAINQDPNMKQCYCVEYDIESNNKAQAECDIELPDNSNYWAIVSNPVITKPSPEYSTSCESNPCEVTWTCKVRNGKKVITSKKIIVESPSRSYSD